MGEHLAGGEDGDTSPRYLGVEVTGMTASGRSEERRIRVPGVARVTINDALSGIDAALAENTATLLPDPDLHQSSTPAPEGEK